MGQITPTGFKIAKQALEIHDQIVFEPLVSTRPSIRYRGYRILAGKTHLRTLVLQGIKKEAPEQVKSRRLKDCAFLFEPDDEELPEICTGLLVSEVKNNYSAAWQCSYEVEMTSVAPCHPLANVEIDDFVDVQGTWVACRSWCVD